MIEDILKNKYGEYLDGLDIYENTSSLILTRIVIKKDSRNTGIGTKILEDLIKYADANKQIIALTPASDFGGSKNRLTQFYKRFGFKHNKGHHKSYQFTQAMIRYPKLNENMKPEIKQLLREGLFNRHSKDQVDMMNEFIDFACDYLKIPHTKVTLQYGREGLVTTAAYGEKKVHVYAKERAVVDIMRSIAHELTHMKQDLEGRLDQSHHDANNKAGSPIEDEANYKAGEIIRKFGEKYPEIYI
jgi:GNAT superfamily N-acetyltransferase